MLLYEDDWAMEIHKEVPVSIKIKIPQSPEES